MCRILAIYIIYLLYFLRVNKGFFHPCLGQVSKVWSMAFETFIHIQALSYMIITTGHHGVRVNKLSENKRIGIFMYMT